MIKMYLILKNKMIKLKILNLMNIKNLKNKNYNLKMKKILIIYLKIKQIFVYRNNYKIKIKYY